MKSVQKASKSKKAVKAAVERASKEAVVEIAGEKFSFPPDIFNLEQHNIGILNEQITHLPADIAYVGTAYAKAQQALARKETAVEMWTAEKLLAFDLARDDKDKRMFTSEGAKKNAMMVQYGKQYEALHEELADLEYVVNLMKVYKDAIEAKYLLSQTLSANIRMERTAYGDGRSM